MANLLPIREIRLSQVQDLIRSALRDGLDPDVIADFVASVDWSGPTAMTVEIAPLLGKLEGLSTEYAEGGLTEAQYRSELLALANECERATSR
jgi:hypothetical protein